MYTRIYTYIRIYVYATCTHTHAHMHIHSLRGHEWRGVTYSPGRGGGAGLRSWHERAQEGRKACTVRMSREEREWSWGAFTFNN